MPVFSHSVPRSRLACVLLVLVLTFLSFRIGLAWRPALVPTGLVLSALTAAPPGEPRTVDGVAHEWTYQTDAARLARDLNAWAAGDSPIPTPLGPMRFQRV